MVHRGRRARPGRRSRPSSTTRRWSAGRPPQPSSDFDGHPTTIYTRTRGRRQVEAVPAILGRHRQPGGAQRGRGVPARPTRWPPRQATDATLNGAAARPRRGGAAGRRRRRGQHHGHLGAGTARRDRPAPLARRHPRPDPHPVPRRVAAAVRARRGRRRRCSGIAVTTGYAAHQTGRRSSRPGRRPAASPPPWSSARSPASTRPAAPPASPRPKPSQHLDRPRRLAGTQIHHPTAEPTVSATAAPIPAPPHCAHADATARARAASGPGANIRCAAIGGDEGALPDPPSMVRLPASPRVGVVAFQGADDIPVVGFS